MAEPLLILAVHAVESLHTAEKIRLLQEAGTVESFASFSRADVERSIRRALRIADFDPGRLLRAAENDLKYLTQAGIAYTFYWNDGYPPLLREIYDPPFVLFYRGCLPDPEIPLLAIVGTRRPTAGGQRSAFALADDVVAAGVPVISGLARGIDSAAHEGAVAGGGMTVAVLGSGIDRIYPLSNRRLAESILASGGCIASEYAPGVPPLRYHFPARNRIISGLARGTVVVEAPAGSGALITADFCLEQGRDLYVHRAGISGPNAAGCASLADQGARTIETAAEILDEWGRTASAERGRTAGKQLPLDLAEPGSGNTPTDSSLPAGSNLQTGAAGRAAAALMDRELGGEVKRRFGTIFRSTGSID